jgi:putative effector of murein hydrolase LrgA (UPF0299 family)
MLAVGAAAAAVVGLFVGVDVVIAAVGLPLPASLVAMLLVFGFCVAIGRVPAALDALARRALPWLPLYFVPACTLALGDLGRLGEAAVAIAAVITVGTVVAGATTAAVARLRARRAASPAGVQVEDGR